MPPDSPPSDESVNALRTPDRTPLLFTTNMGLEDVVIDEFTIRCAAVGTRVTGNETQPFDLNSYAWVESPAPPTKLLPLARRMRSAHHVLAPLYTFDLPMPDPLETIRATLAQVDVPAVEHAATFRVTSVRQGDHDFTSIDVQRAAGAGLQAQYTTTVDLETYDVEVRVDVFDRRCLVSIQHTRAALSQRHARVYASHAALKPNVAYGLLHLAQLDAAPRVVLDPFCGSGTILLEAAACWPTAALYGSDWSDAAVAGTRTNAATEGIKNPLVVRTADARRLTDAFPATKVDLIATNPPFGVRIGDGMNFVPFYRDVLQQAAHVLVPGGRLVLLTLQQAALNRVLHDVNAFRIRHVRVIEVGGSLYPRVFVLERT